MLPFQCVNGQVTPSAQSVLQISDLGLLRGYGIFDYFLIREGKTVFMSEHIQRFFRSAAQLKMEVPFTERELVGQVADLVKANGIADAGIRLLLTGGYADDGYTPSGTCNCLILQHRYAIPGPELYAQGIHLMLHNYQRDLPEVKSTNYLVPVALQERLRDIGADDVLYHFNDFVSETSRANLFIITQDGRLVTSTGNVLKGITRNKLLPLAEKVMPVEERLFTLTELREAAEAFITSTTKGVLAVTRIDQQPVADGKPGSKTLTLAEHLKEFSKNHLATKTALI